MGHECALVYVDEVTGWRIGDTSYSTKQDLSLRGIESADTNVMVLRRLGVAEENEVTAVRQEVRPAMCFLFRIDFSGEFRRSALRGNTMQAFWSTKENHAFTTPRGARGFSY